MNGQRIINDWNFECTNLSNREIEYFSAFYSEHDKQDVLMLVLKLEGVPLYQRFFLDAAIGFWEEWDKDTMFCDIEDLEKTDLLEDMDLRGKKITSIVCEGSYEKFASIRFSIDDVSLLLKFSNSCDFESDIVLIKL